MAKKCVGLSIIICILLLFGCQNNQNSLLEYTLVVNGQEIPNDHHLKIDFDKRYAELPLIAIGEAMGAQVVREATSNGLIKTEKVTISYNDYSLVLDTAERDLNVHKPEWLIKPIRKAKNDELILDSCSVAPFFYHEWEFEITIDYRNAVVYVNALDADTLTYSSEELDKVNCKLIVDGKDITEGNYVYINHEQSNAELPVIAIVKALGGKVEWLPCKPYPIKDRCIVAITLNGATAKYDTSASDFGIGFLTGVSGLARKVMGNEVIIDSRTLDSYFYHVFQTVIRVDYKDSVIYVTPIRCEN